MKPEELPSSELQRRRERIRRDFLRANTAVAAILIAVLALAVGAVLESFRAAGNQRKAEIAERRSEEQLWESYLNKARGMRLSGELNRRAEVLDTVRNAAAIKVSAALRTEAIAGLALNDFVQEHSWPVPKGVASGKCDQALQRLAFGYRSGDVDIHRIADHALLQQLRGADSGSPRELGAAVGLEFSPDGTQLAVRYHEGAVVVWDLATGAPVYLDDRHWDGFSWVNTPKFSSDGRFLIYMVLEPLEGLLVAEVMSGATVCHFPQFHGPTIVEPRPGTTMLAATAVGDFVLLIDWNTGVELEAIPFPETIYAMAWSGDGSYLALAGNIVDIHLWQVDEHERRVLSGHSAEVLHLAFDPDGQWLLSSSWDGTTRLWQTASGRLAGVTDQGQADQFGPDGRLVLSHPLRSGSVWRIQPSPIFHSLDIEAPRREETWSMDLSQDGRWVAVKLENEALVCDAETGRTAGHVEGRRLRLLNFHPSEPELLLTRGSRTVSQRLAFDGAAESAAVRVTETKTIPLPRTFSPYWVSAARTGTTAAFTSAFNDGRILVVDLASPEHQMFLQGAQHCVPHIDTLHCGGSATGGGTVALSGDGRWVACGFNRHPDGSAQVWDAHTGALVASLSPRKSVVAFSPDDRWLALGEDGQFRLFRVGDWKEMWHAEREGSPRMSGSCAFSPDGGLLAAAVGQQKIALLDVATGREVARLEAPRAATVRTLRWSGDGRRIAVGTTENLVQVWDMLALRDELAVRGLAWDAASPLAATALPLTTSVGVLAPVIFGMVAVTLVAVMALLALRRHRLLIADFARTESESQQRSKELEVARVELMHSQKMKALGTLAAGIAHDFNNLLSVIRMSNKLVSRELKDHPEVAEELANIEEAVQQGKHVVGSMLGYSRERPDDGRPCDLDEIVEETVSLLSKEFLSGIELTLALDRDAPPVRVGRGRLEQILLNLIVNAAEAMKGQGRLNIGVHARERQGKGDFVLRPRSADRFVELSVGDSGPGIDPDILPRIFEPFFTTKTSGVKQGTGLGLSLVYTIAEQDGLGIAVRTQPAQGSMFIVLVPVA